VLDLLKDPEKIADILCTPQEAVRLGISVEKRSILFYNQILKNTRDKSGRIALENLIKQEQDHVRKLESFLRK
jgi:rubrerythrin